jgi:hypothetical protein
MKSIFDFVFKVKFVLKCSCTIEPKSLEVKQGTWYFIWYVHTYKRFRSQKSLKFHYSHTLTHVSQPNPINLKPHRALPPV